MINVHTYPEMSTYDIRNGVWDHSIRPTLMQQFQLTPAMMRMRDVFSSVDFYMEAVVVVPIIVSIASDM